MIGILLSLSMRNIQSYVLSYYLLLFSQLVIYYNNGYGPRSCYSRDRSLDQFCATEINLNLQWACFSEVVCSCESFIVLSFLTQSRIMDSHDKLPCIDKLNDSN